MSEKLSATIEVGLDGSKVQDGVAPITRTLDNLGKTARKAGKDASDGISKIGEGGASSAAKVESATRSMIGSIQRTTAALEAGTKSGAEYFEALARQRGVDPAVLRPYLAQLDAVREKQEAAATSSAAMSTALKSAGLVAVGAITGFATLVKGTIDASDGLNDLSKTTGIAVEQLAGLRLAAQQSGGDLEGIAKSINKLSVNIGKDGEKFKQLGIDAKDPLEAFKQLSDVFKSIDDPQTRAALGAAALGKSWESAAPLLSEGSEAIGEMVAKGTALSGVTSQLTSDSDAFNDSIAELSAGIAGQFAGATTALLPLMGELAKNLSDASAAAKSSPSDFSPLAETFRGLIVLGGNVAFVFKGVGTEIGGIAAQLTSFAKGDFQGAMAIGEAMKRDAEQARKEFDAWEQKILEVGTVAKEVGKEITKALTPDEAAAKAAADARAAAFIKASNEVSAEIKKQENAYKTLTREIEHKLALSDLELNSEKPLTESQKLRVKLLELVEQSHGRVTKAQIFEQTKKIELIRANELLRDSYIRLDKDLGKLKISSAGDIVSEINRQDQAFSNIIKTQDEYRQSLEDNNNLAQLELSLLGQSATERGIIIEKYKIELELQKQIRAIKAQNLESGQQQFAIDEATANANIAKSQASIKIQQQEWAKFYDDIYNGLSDSLYRGFEAGKGFFQSFWDGIKNLFKTTVLKLAVQGVMTGILGAGFAGVANASPSASAFGGAGNLISVGKSIYDGFSLAAGAGAGVTAIGNLLGSSAISAFGAGMGLSSSAAAGAAGAYSAAGMGTTASAITAGSTVGMVLPYLAAAAVLYKGLSMGDKQLGGQTVSGTLGTSDLMRNQSWTQSGGFLRGDRSGVWSYGLKDSTAIQDGKSYVDTANIANDQALLKVINDGYAALKNASTDYAKTLGLNADLIANRTDAINFSLGKTDAERQANLTAAFTGVGNAIAEDLLGNLVSLKKAGEDSGTELARLAQTFKVTNDFLSVLGKNAIDVFGGLSASSLEARQRLIDLVGGVDNLNSSAAFFAQNFLSEGERLAPSIKAVSEQMDLLGLASVTTVEQFKQTVQGIDYSTEAGAKMYATLMNIAPAFKLVADYSEKAAAQVIADAQAKADAEIKAQQAAQKAAEDMARQVADQAAEEAKRIADAQSAARATLEAAYNAEAQGIENVIGKLKSFSTSIRSFLESLAINNSTLSPEEAFKEAQRQYADTLSRASNGDDAAQQALTGKAQAYNEAIKNYFGSSKAGADALDAMKNELGAIAEQTDAQLVAAERQMNILKSQVSQLINIDKSVGSVTDAIKALQEALKPTVKSAPKAALAYDEHLYGLNPDGTRRQMAGETAAEFIASMIPGFQRSLVQSWYAANPNASAPDRNSIDYWVDQIAKLGQLGAEDAFNTAVAKLTNTEQVNKPLVWSTFQNQGATDNTEVLNKISEHLEALVVVQQTANPEIIDGLVSVGDTMDATRRAAALARAE